jgi:hypothetical protein
VVVDWLIGHIGEIEEDKLIAETRKLVDVPLMLHGVSSLSDSDLRRCFERGIRCFKIGSVIRNAFFSKLDRRRTVPEVQIFAGGKEPSELVAKGSVVGIRLCPQTSHYNSHQRGCLGL